MFLVMIAKPFVLIVLLLAARYLAMQISKCLPSWLKPLLLRRW